MEREVHAKARVCNAALTADQSIKTTGKSKERRKPLCFPRTFTSCPGYRKFQRLYCWHSAEHILPRSQRPEGAERETVLEEAGNWTVAHAWRLSLAIPPHCPRRQAYAAPTVPITPSLVSSRPVRFPSLRHLASLATPFYHASPANAIKRLLFSLSLAMTACLGIV